MNFHLLGPLEIRAGDGPIGIAAGKQRALLVLLLLDANRSVSRDRIVDALWGEDAPASSAKMVQILVSQLRKSLPEPRVVTRPPGYLLEVAEGELDLHRFERGLTEGRDALAQGDPQRARELLAGALALWRGHALAELSEPFARHEAARLEELRLTALERRLDADLALGHHQDVVAELEALTGEQPLRERLHAQLMLALYRSGRQAEALAAFQAFRGMLAGELGLEPSASLRDLERRMLRQDASLELETTAPAPAGAGEDVRYARSGDTRIAYQVIGDGAPDLVLVHGWVCTFQPGWEHPRMAAFYRRLASLGRLILFDKRGTGLSDRVSPEHLPDLETRMDDVRAVLDAVGSERAVVIGVSEGGPMSALFAATYPGRTSALVLIGSFARTRQAPDYPIGVSEDAFAARLATVDEDDWAAAMTEEWLERVGPRTLRDPAAMRWYTSYLRRGASPAASRAMRLMNAQIDVRDVLPTIAVPTLVVYRSEEYFRDATRFMGERIPGARIVVAPGDDHLPWEGDQEPVLQAIEELVAAASATEPDRVLATVLVLEAAAPPGDDYRRLVRSHLARFRARELSFAGGVVAAAFDGPARAVRCGGALVGAARDLGLVARAGVHTGEIDRLGGDGGETARLAARIAAAAAPGTVLVSAVVRDLVAGSGLRFGEHEAGEPPHARLFVAST